MIETMNDVVAINHRVLVIDDNPAILEDYRKILTATKNTSAVHATREALFDTAYLNDSRVLFEMECASQGLEGLDLVKQAIHHDLPYAVVFVDMRMPPGWDGVETAERIWEVDPDLQIVICTAFSDHAWEELIPRLGRRDQLLILRKPFDPIEVHQLANALTYKWHWAHHAKLRLDQLEILVDRRTADLQEANERLEQDVLRRQAVEQQLAQTVQELEGRNGDLHKARDQALIEIHERERAELALRHKTEELARSNRELDQFASVASHDLQEPLHTIQVLADLLNVKWSNALGSNGQEFLSRIHKATSRMQRLIQDLLIYSRLDTKESSMESVDLSQVVEEILSDFSVRIEETHATVEVHALPVVDAGRIHMRQLMQNLIGNALKFHRPGENPVVRISAALMEDRRRDSGESSGRLCQLKVEDQGIGMEEHHLDRIFEMFKRLHGRDEYEGTGIGLAVCKKIVRRYGGNITVQSQREVGSTFLVTLPVKSIGRET